MHVAHGDPKPSHVLTAIGNEERWIKGVLRITFGMENTKQDVDYLIKNLVQIVNELRNKK